MSSPSHGTNGSASHIITSFHTSNPRLLWRGHQRFARGVPNPRVDGLQGASHLLKPAVEEILHHLGWYKKLYIIREANYQLVQDFATIHGITIYLYHVWNLGPSTQKNLTSHVVDPTFNKPPTPVVPWRVPMTSGRLRHSRKSSAWRSSRQSPISGKVCMIFGQPGAAPTHHGPRGIPDSNLV